jgi:uncharacterized alkaline shock family protein YloU
MTTAAASLGGPGAPATAPNPGWPSPTTDALLEAGERGSLTIAEQVVEKIAATALGEVDHVGGAARRVLGVALGSDSPDRPAQVHALVNGSLATLEVTCSVTYPAPVATVTERARSRIIERVEQLTGLAARQVDITVTTLTTTVTSNRRELQ